MNHIGADYMEFNMKSMDRKSPFGEESEEDNGALIFRLLFFSCLMSTSYDMEHKSS